MLRGVRHEMGGRGRHIDDTLVYEHAWKDIVAGAWTLK
jgi:hypothetical protein